ncbi:ABC transporter substrate-binding protein [Nitritalea halalkaliphila LW7]|uniref:ABC transporter substrate-binding protein n=1 Tax=Nitritalea halalkaliphila LW7 TaxID=1189621 RepID=I5CA52_9BACT|nr:ABC transporter substrate-binding protein [Nitritalea halalkaliphila]EIM78704.1 ABC transporter substrate-binding protein [Nitritalea halalkaliphila LW7]
MKLVNISLLRPQLIPFFCLLWLSITLGCNPKENGKEHLWEPVPLAYAKGFKLYKINDYLLIEILQGYPGQEKPAYLLLGEAFPDQHTQEALHSIRYRWLPPAQRLVATATSHLPALEEVEALERLIGFPNTDLISSTRVRERIRAGKLQDLGKNAGLNIEAVLDLQPDLVLNSTLGAEDRSAKLLEEAGIYVLSIGDFIEPHPLGRAEWCKVIGAVVGHYAAAEEVFESIAARYEALREKAAARKSAQRSDQKPPRVMTGNLYQDIWYVPSADSWSTQLIRDAGGHYLFEELKGAGSQTLSFEQVLDRALDADIWLGPSDIPSLAALALSDQRYTYFTPFKTQKVFSFGLKKSATGGLPYFEIAYLRPDLILEDLMRIFGGESLPEEQMHFYLPLPEN